MFFKQNLDPSVGSVGARGGRPCSDDSSERDARGENPAGIGTKKRRERAGAGGGEANLHHVKQEGVVGDDSAIKGRQTSTKKIRGRLGKL